MLFLLQVTGNNFLQQSSSSASANRPSLLQEDDGAQGTFFQMPGLHLFHQC